MEILLGRAPIHDSAENPMNASTGLSMNEKIFNDFNRSSVRPEILEG
jgi:hypothetical protein